MISFETIEMLLNKLRASEEFNGMKKTARKRLYAIFVESIENICKYSANSSANDEPEAGTPLISVEKRLDKYLIRAGNMVPNDHIDALRFKLERVNQLGHESLKSLYEDVIHKKSESDDSGAGLGLITIALRTDYKLKYSFRELDRTYSFFEMQVTINE